MSGRVYKKNWRRWKRYGQKKAAASQTDLAKVVLKQNTVFTAKYDATSKIGVAAINVWDVLANNPTFINNKKNYDQVKINLASVKLTVADAAMTAATASQIKSYQIILAWDRTGLSEGQYDLIEDNETHKITSWDCKVGEAIAGYSSAKKSQLNSFQRWNGWMGIGAKNIMEKGMYFSTDLISPFSDAQNAKTGVITLANPNYTIDYWYNNANPCVPIEMASVPFKPTLLVGVFASGFDSGTGAINKYADTPPVVFNAEWSFDITYRGIRGTMPIEDIVFLRNLYNALPLDYDLLRSEITQTSTTQLLDDIILETMVQDQEGDLRNVTIARIEPTLAAELTQYENNVPITTNGIHNINFLTTINRAVQQYKVSVEVPQNFVFYIANGISLTTNGNYPLSDFIPATGYDGVQKDTVVKVNVPQLYTPETVAIGPLLRNGTYNLSNYIDIGFNCLSSSSTVEVRVDEKIVIDGIRKGRTGTIIPTLNFTYNNAYIQNYVVGRDETLIKIQKDGSNDQYKVYIYSNTTTSFYVSLSAGDYYYTVSNLSDMVYFTSANSNVLGVEDVYKQDSRSVAACLSYNYFSILFSV